MSPYNKSRGGGTSDPALPLILDVYTGAAAAYSLRKIALATTNVIRVRRTNGLLPVEQDFTAAQITDGTLLAFTGSGDGRVVTWYDQSGNNAHAIQPTINRQPRIVLNGALVLDSSGVNPTLEFHIGNVGCVLNAPLVSAQPLTLFNLRRYRVAGTGTRVAIGYAGGGNSYADNNIGGSFRTYYGSYVIQGANNTDREIFYSLANGASTAVSLNGGSEVVGNAGTAGASALTIGAAGVNFPPRINEQEVIIYDSNQASNKSGILTNINAHYNVYSVDPVDPDAQAFISAALITGTTQQDAIKGLVPDLKGTSGNTTNGTDVWSKLAAVYPMCPIDGTTFTLDACKWNLINPLDTDAAFRMTWVNAPTVSYGGVKGDGSAAYKVTVQRHMATLIMRQVIF
jgi:hypothetical protein